MMGFSHSAETDEVILVGDAPRTASASTHIEVHDQPPSAHRQKKSARSIIFDHANAFFRSLSLQIVNYLFSWQNTSEPPKVAIQQSRSFSLARASVHILPIMGCMTLIILNSQPHFIFHYNSWYTILQFVAKVHEVLMQASIATVLLGYVRQQILRYTAIPFGGILAPAQITNISYLWSLEFWGVLTTQCLKGWRKVTFALFILLSALLAASVGPSSAIAMLPRVIQVRVATAVYAVRVADAFPQHITSSYEAYADMKAIASLRQGASDLVLSGRIGGTAGDRGPGVRSLTVSPNVSPHDWLSGTIAFTTPLIIAKVVEQLFLWLNITDNLMHYATEVFTVTYSKQPYVHAACETAIVNGTLNSTFFTFPAATNGTFDTIITQGQFLDTWKNTDSAHLIWLEPSQPDKDNYSILAVLGWPKIFGIYSSVQACALKAAWLPSRINTTYTRSGSITQGHGINEQLNLEPPSWLRPVVSIDKGWAKSLTSSDKVGPDVLSIFGPHYTGALIASIVATGMSDIGSGADSITEYVGGFPGSLGRTPDSQRRFPGSSGDYDSKAQNVTAMNFEAFAAGIGYYAQTVPVILALVILTIYCVFAISYITYSLISGLSANSWDSMAEITALALNSKCPDYLGNTSVGLQTVKVFQEPVSIRARGDKRVALVFERDANNDGDYTRVAQNHAY